MPNSNTKYDFLVVLSKYISKCWKFLPVFIFNWHHINKQFHCMKYAKYRFSLTYILPVKDRIVGTVWVIIFIITRCSFINSWNFLFKKSLLHWKWKIVKIPNTKFLLFDSAVSTTFSRKCICCTQSIAWMGFLVYFHQLGEIIKKSSFNSFR